MIVSVSASGAVTDTLLKIERPKVGLVLSGGGAKGAAHIGVLRMIEKMGIPIDYIAGTSIGALVGGMYAMGYSVDEIEAIMKGLEWDRYLRNSVSRDDMNLESVQQSEMFNLSVPFAISSKNSSDLSFQEKIFASSLPGGIINGHHVLTLINSLSVGYHDNMSFGELPIPFACVALDVVSKKEVVFKEGSLPMALRASMSLPGVFSPVQIDDMVLVDGGLKNDFPVDVCKEMGADIIIGSLLPSSKSKVSVTSIVGLLPAIVSSVVQNKTPANIAQCDICVEPPVADFSTMAFDQKSVDSMIAISEEYVESMVDQFIKVKEEIYSHGLQGVRSRDKIVKNIYSESVDICDVVLEGVEDGDKKWLLIRSGIADKKQITQEDLDMFLNLCYGSDCYESIIPSLEGNCEPYRLVFRFKSKQPHLFRIGVRADAEEAASLLLKAQFNDNRLNGPRLGVQAKINYSPYVMVDAQWSHHIIPTIGLSYKFHHSTQPTYIDKDLNYFDCNNHKARLYLELPRMKHLISDLSLKYDNYSVADNIINKGFIKSYNTLSLDFNIIADNRDAGYFTTRGIYTHINGNWVFKEFETNRQYGSISLDFRGAISMGDRFTLLPSLYARGIVGDRGDNRFYANYLGGRLDGRYFDYHHSFVGFSNMAYMGDYMAQVRLDARCRVYKEIYLSAIGNYNLSTPSLVQFDPTHLWGVGLECSLKTFLGPIGLTVHYSNFTNRVGVAFNFGFDF